MFLNILLQLLQALKIYKDRKNMLEKAVKVTNISFGSEDIEPDDRRTQFGNRKKLQRSWLRCEQIFVTRAIDIIDIRQDLYFQNRDQKLFIM